MNVKWWALFFVVTLSVNYVCATFLPFGGGGGSRGRGRRRSHGGWNVCNERLHEYISSNMKSIRRTVQSRYGGHFSLEDRRLDDYTLKKVSLRGFDHFTVGDNCQYNIENEEAFIRFTISFRKIFASFLLVAGIDVGGILGTLIGIIDHFVDKFLHFFVSFIRINIVLIGNYKSGFRLHDFNVQKPESNLGFLGDLAGHSDIHRSCNSLFFEPILHFINVFLEDYFRVILADGIGHWDHSKDIFARLGLGFRFGGRRGGSRFRKVSGTGDLDGEESGLGGKTGRSESGDSELYEESRDGYSEDRHGGSRFRKVSGTGDLDEEESGLGGKTGRSESGDSELYEESRDGYSEDIYYKYYYTYDDTEDDDD